MHSAPLQAVTFDFGQTLAELDTGMLSRRLSERGLAVAPERLYEALGAGWTAYNRAIRQGLGGHPWKTLMAAVLTHAGTPSEAVEPAVDWLWTEQPRANLWRRPIPGMIELVRALRALGVPVGVVSNSEGRLAELVEELGWSEDFVVIADSGALGMEKPSPGIFHWTCERLGVHPSRVAHVGDAWVADVEGALGAGLRAVLFRGRETAPPDAELERPGVRVCDDAVALRALLRAWGLSGA
jgi:putative hydrolase of the HAD superfamily